MYIVITGSQPNQTVRERNLSDCEWNETVSAIASGEWTDISEVRQTSTGFDVLPSMAEEVARIWDLRDEPLSDWQEEFVRQYVVRTSFPSLFVAAE